MSGVCVREEVRECVCERDIVRETVSESLYDCVLYERELEKLEGNNSI